MKREMISGEIYSRVFNNARTGLLLLDRATGCVLAANAAFLGLAAYPHDQVVGRNFWQPPLIADPSAGAELYEHFLAGGFIDDVELPFKTGDGRALLLNLAGSPVDGIVQLEVHDATSRFQAKFTERMDRLRFGARRTAVEFQNLNRTLQMVGELLLVNANRDRPVLRALSEVQQAAERAGIIAGQLFAFSEDTPLQPRRMSLNNLIQAMLPRLRQSLGREVELVHDLHPELGPVFADPAHVRQIILHLAANSAEAMTSHGMFSIQTRNATARESASLNGGAPSGSYAMLVVTDTGAGLDDESWVISSSPSPQPNPTGTASALAYPPSTASYARAAGISGRIASPAKALPSASIYPWLP